MRARKAYRKAKTISVSAWLIALACLILWCPGAQSEVISDSPMASTGDASLPAHSTGLVDALLGGKWRALIRYSGQRRNSNLQVLQDSSTPNAPTEKIQQYSALGGYLGYQTSRWFNLSAGATLYTGLPFGPNAADHRGLGGLYEDDGGQDPYAALGEAWLQWEHEGHRVKAGRQEIPGYRFVSLSNVRVTPITHTGVIYENRAWDQINFNLGYVSSMKERNARTFIDMARGARLTDESQGKQVIRGEYDTRNYENGEYVGDNKEMVLAGLTYGNDRVALEGWLYTIKDFVNIVYLFGEYAFTPGEGDFSYAIAAQYTRQNDTGSRIAGNIDTYHWGLKLSGTGRGLHGFIGYNKVDYNEASYDGGTLFVRWGTPQMFNSFQVQDSELAGTESIGLGVQYDFGLKDILPGTVMRLRAGFYDLPDRLVYTDARQDRAEFTFDLRYSFRQRSTFGIFTEMKGLSLQFRLAYNDYRTDYDFEAYRQIHGYDFRSVTKDFIDARLYLDYLF